MVRSERSLEQFPNSNGQPVSRIDVPSWRPAGRAATSAEQLPASLSANRRRAVAGESWGGDAMSGEYEHGGLRTAQSEATPSKAVVEPAVAELLVRLRRARSRPGIDHHSLLGDADRRVFALAMDKRKQVLEGALGLVLGQWALYRVAFKQTPRPVRVAFGLGAAGVTMQYATRRATQVTHDMFVSILNLPEDSSLGNEARIVLAGLEGPDGPFYASAVAEDLRKRVYERALTQVRAADAEDVHPQLALQPRLMRGIGAAPSAAEDSTPSLANGGSPGLQRPPRTVVNTGRGPADEDEGIDPFPALLPEGEPDDLPLHGGADRTPYDFAAATRRGQGDDADARHPLDHQDDDGGSDRAETGPGERRAAERALRRRRAKSRPAAASPGGEERL
jgi:hypothetical protein